MGFGAGWEKGTGFLGGGFGEGHAWELREMENCSAGKGALRSARRKGSRVEIGERVGS